MKKRTAWIVVIAMMLLMTLSGITSYADDVVVVEFVDIYGQDNNTIVNGQSDPVHIQSGEAVQTYTDGGQSSPQQGSDSTPVTYNRVTFYDMYGWEYAWAEVASGSTVEPPQQDPYVEGFVFHYWFDEMDPNHTPFNFNAGITQYVNLLPRFTALNTIVDGVVGDSPMIVDSVVMSTSQMEGLITQVLNVAATETGSNVTMSTEQVDTLIGEVLGNNIVTEPETVLIPSTQVENLVDQILMESSGETGAVQTTMTQETVDSLIADVLGTTAQEPEAAPAGQEAPATPETETTGEALIAEITQQEEAAPAATTAAEQPTSEVYGQSIIDEILNQEPAAVENATEPVAEIAAAEPETTEEPAIQISEVNILDVLLDEMAQREEKLESIAMPEDDSRDLVREMLEEMITNNAPVEQPPALPLQVTEPQEEPSEPEEVLPDDTADNSGEEPDATEPTEADGQETPDETASEEDGEVTDKPSDSEETGTEGTEAEAESGDEPDGESDEAAADETEIESESETESEGETDGTGDEEADAEPGTDEETGEDGEPETEVETEASDEPTVEDEMVEVLDGDGNVVEDGAEEAAQPSIRVIQTIEPGMTENDPSWVTVTAELAGFPEGANLAFQWQNNASGVFEDVPGATERSYTFQADENNTGCHWQVSVTFVD